MGLGPTEAASAMIRQSFISLSPVSHERSFASDLRQYGMEGPDKIWMPVVSSTRRTRPSFFHVKSFSVGKSGKFIVMPHTTVHTQVLRSVEYCITVQTWCCCRFGFTIKSFLSLGEFLLDVQSPGGPRLRYAEGNSCRLAQ